MSLTKRRNDGVSYEHPRAFWLGVLATTAGVVMQLPMYWMARHDHFHMYGMPVSTEMMVGMLLIVIGVGMVFYAVFPKKGQGSPQLSKIKIGAMDDAKIRKAHVALLLALAAAITIDVMKPVALAFIAPGAAVEYGLKGPLNPDSLNLPVALYPFSGITGTVAGSLIWGWFGDRIGRRRTPARSCATPRCWASRSACRSRCSTASGVLRRRYSAWWR